MPELCGGLFILFLVLGLITLVGHGIWVLLAAMFTGGGPPPVGKGGTGEAAADRDRPAATEWTVAANQLHRLRDRGLLSQAKLDEIMEVLREERAERRRVQMERARKAVAEPEESPLSVEVVSAEPAAEEPVEIVEFEFEEVAEEPAAEERVEPVAPARPFAERKATNQGAERKATKPRPKRELGTILQAFMEEKNIRWGELVSGMLIVGSAIGLVISLWSTLEQTIPYFPALLFMLGTAAIHGAGLYTLKRWNLKSTSRGLLLISTLLIPLNFLAAIALSGEPGSPNYVAASSPIYFIAVAVGALCYGAIAYSAGRVFRKRHWWVLWSAVMIPAIGQLVIARQAVPGMTTGWINLLAAIPLLGFALAMAAQLRLGARGRFSRRRAEQTFQTLGVGLFSFGMALGLLISRTVEGWWTMAQLSPIVSVLSVLATAGGLIVHVRATRDSLSGHRTAGTAISLTGSALMLAGLVLAWPQPDLLIAVGIVDAVALICLAISARLPILHVPAVAAISLTVIIGLHWAQGTISTGTEADSVELFEAFLMGRSSLMFLGLAAVAACVSLIWRKSGRKEEGVSYLWSAAGLGGLSLFVALFAGFITQVDQELTTPVFAVAAIGSFALCQLGRRPWAAWTGAALLFVSLLHATVLNEPVVEFLGRFGLLPQNPAILAGLLTATISTALGLFVAWRMPTAAGDEDPGPARSEVLQQLHAAGIAFSALCLPPVIFGDLGPYALHSGYVLWAAALWFVSAIALQSRALFMPAQGLSFIGVGFLAVTFAQRMPWWNNNFADPRYWQMQLCCLAGWCVAWGTLRQFISPESTAGKLLGKREFNVDHAVLAGTLLGAAVLAILGALPGITAELRLISGTDFGFANFSPEPPDVLAATGILALSFGALFAVGLSTVREHVEWFIPAGLAAIAIVGTQLTRVSAESFAQAVSVSHALAYGVGTWALLGIVAVGLLLTFWERVTTVALCGLALLGGLVPVLVSGMWEETIHTATALRYGLVSYAVVLVILFGVRRRIGGLLRGLGSRIPEADSQRRVSAVKATGVVVTLWPVLAITLYAALHVAGGNAIAGANAASVFGNVDFGLSYAVPFWVFAVVGVVLAELTKNRAKFISHESDVVRNEFRTTSGEFSYLGGSLLVQLGMVLLFALPHWLWAGNLGGVGLAALLQWSGVGLGVTTLLWAGWRLWRYGADANVGTDGLAIRPTEVDPLTIQLNWNVATVGLLSVWAMLAIIVSPTELGPVIQRLGHPLGFVAFGLTVAGLAVARRWLPKEWKADGFALAGVLFVPLIAAASLLVEKSFEIGDTWLAYHVLIAGWGIVTAGLTGLSVTRFGEQNSTATRLMRSALALVGVLVFLGFRAQFADPQRPWWFVGTSAFAAAVCVVFGIARRKQSFAYASGGLTLLATIAALSKPWIGLAPEPTLATYLHVLLASLIATAGVGLFWLTVEVFWQRTRGEDLDTMFNAPPVHHAAAGLGIIFTAAYGVIALFARELAAGEIASRIPLLLSPVGAAVLVSGVGLLLASLWDRRAVHAIPGLFVLGLVACVAVLDGMNAGLVIPDLTMEIDHVWFGLGAIAAGYVAITAVAWSARQPLAAVSLRLGIPEEIVENSGTEKWLPWADLALAAFATVIGFWAVLWFEDRALRYAAGIATAVLAPGLALFGSPSRERHAAAFRFLSLLTAVIAAVQLAWAFPLEAVGRAELLQRAILLLEVVSVATLIYAAGITKLLKPESAWGRSFRSASIAAGGTALVALGTVLLLEATLFDPKQVPITTPQIAVISVILVGLAGGLILLAVVPGRDPFQLSERGRMAYVYAAEVVASLLFLHIYLTKPRLFHGLLRPYWSFIVIGIAFAGVGLAEWFRRRKLRVLSEPLERTGTFLPLLPVLAFWVIASEQRFDKYSLVLLLAGLVYVLLASLRKSFLYSLAAAVLANLALWSMFHHAGIVLLSRPQLWLIPPAISLLTAAQLNRHRLSEAQLTAIRYFSVLTIYASSTGEMFIHSAADPKNFWHPMLLAGLSVAGILAGMLMRVRAFLYLGTTFLFLSLVSMVWHAARAIDEVWPWWVFGIVLGIAMLVLFGLFEKKRDEVLGTFKRLKEWDA